MTAPDFAPEQSSATRVFGREWRDDWRATLGPGWAYLLAGFAICLFVGGATVPLSDADLPMHLALGEWIARHGRVPFTEPFAWTRPDAPFYAYSWGAEVVYYELLRIFGPVAVQMLHGVILLASCASVLVLGAVLRWSGWTTLLVGALHVLIAVGIVPALRPQGVLMAVVPAAWALAFQLRVTARPWLCYGGLALCACIAANSHLFFPIVAVTGVALITPAEIQWRRVVGLTIAILIGWAASPYALHWRDVFALNFAPNALYRFPSPVGEHTPGFMAFIRGGGTALLISPLLIALPWLTSSRLVPRARFWYGLTWLVGLFGFGIAIRALLPWWLMTLPLTGVAVGLLAPPQTPVVITAQRAIVSAIFGAMSIMGGGRAGDPWLRAGSLDTRRLPSVAASGIEPIAEWLDCSMNRAATGRLLTVFNFGNYAMWRLSHLSASIDGRTIFPDSVAAAEGFFLPVSRTLPLPPWRSADLAILPLGVPVAGVLDSASGWQRVATVSDQNGPASIIGLWIRRDWWTRAGHSPLPARPVYLFHRPDVPACR